MSHHYRNRTISLFGAFGSFGGAGLEVFPGGPAFQGGDSYNIFFDDGSSKWAQGATAYGLSWTAPSNAIVRACAKVWADIDNAGSAGDAAYKEAAMGRLNALVKSIDSLAGSHDVFGYSQAVTTQLIARMNDLKRELQRIAVYKVTPLTPEEALLPAVSSSDPLTSTPSAGHGGTNAGGPPAPDEGIPWLYIGLGLGAVALLAGGVVLLKPKRMSGYRRSPRRSRR